MRALWRSADFRRLWLAQTVSGAGGAVGGIALPLTAVLWLGAGPVEMGILRALSNVPVLLFALLAGVWVDRLRRRPLLIAGDLGRAALFGLIPLAALTGTLRLELLYAVTLLAGVCAVFYDVASTTYLPALVPRATLVQANGALQTSSRAVGIVGPGVAGPLVQLVGAPLAVAIDALSFLVSAVLLGRVRTDPPPPDRPRSGIWPEAVEGMSLLWRDPILRPLTLATTWGSLGGAVGSAVVILFAVDELGLSPAALGGVFAVSGAAGLAGAAAAGPVARRLGTGPALLWAHLVMVCGELLTPAAGLVGGAPALVVGRALAAGGLTLFSVNQISLRQAVTPPELLGRVNAARRLLVFGIQPFGALLGGALGAALGLRAALLLCAALEAIGLLVALRSPLRTLRDQDG